MGNCQQSFYCTNNDCVQQVDSSYEVLLGQFYLEPFQNMSNTISSLDKYNQFYRFIGEPFCRIKINDYIDELNHLIINC